MSIKTIKAARAKAMQCSGLLRKLKEWFAKKGSCPDPEVKDLPEWVERRIDYLSGHMGKCRKTVDSLLVALKVQAGGDFYANLFSVYAELAGWTTDINCYVEEGRVYASVWLSGKDDAKKTENLADAMAMEFRKLGYDAEIWIDEEDEHDVTVHASIDFPAYYKLVKKGGR